MANRRKRTDELQGKHPSSRYEDARKPVAQRVNPPKAPPNLHPLAKRFWDSLKKSPASRYFLETDWQYAAIWATALSEQLKREEGPTAAFLAQFQLAADRLLVTEGARLKHRIEVQISSDPEDADSAEDDNTVSIDDWRQRLSAAD